MKTVKLTILVSLVVLIYSCSGNSNTDNNVQQGVEAPQPSTEINIETHQNGISLTKFTGSPEYTDATLKLNNSTTNQDGTTTFEFATENYELGVQTKNAGTNGLAFSAKGQHIHFIDNNGPYSAHYEGTFSKELKEGPHIVLAFLARSYHESVKNKKAAVVTQFYAGGEGRVKYKQIDLSGPVMFYSRPKGTYKGEDTKKILLDFYLLNTTLSQEGFKVRATINDEEFLLTEWMPYVIEGAPLGELKVKLELLNAEGELVIAPFNPVERTVTLVAE